MDISVTISQAHRMDRTAHTNASVHQKTATSHIEMEKVLVLTKLLIKPLD
jgi:hypothetical protein